MPNETRRYFTGCRPSAVLDWVRDHNDTITDPGTRRWARTSLYGWLAEFESVCNGIKVPSLRNQFKAEFEADYKDVRHALRLVSARDQEVGRTTT